MAIKLAVPVLRVADVGRSIEWYRGTLAFVGDPFPPTPPFEFAILRHGQVELMLRRGLPPVRSKPRQYDWDVYLQREGERFREVFAAFSARGIVTRRLERMPYGLAEFEITDPRWLCHLSQPDARRCKRFANTCRLTSPASQRRYELRFSWIHLVPAWLHWPLTASNSESLTS